MHYQTMTTETAMNPEAATRRDQRRAMVGKCYKRGGDDWYEVCLVTDVLDARTNHFYAVTKRVKVDNSEIETGTKLSIEPDCLTYLLSPFHAECTRAEYDAVIAKIRAALDGGE